MITKVNYKKQMQIELVPKNLIYVYVGKSVTFQNNYLNSCKEFYFDIILKIRITYKEI